MLTLPPLNDAEQELYEKTRGELSENFNGSFRETVSIMAWYMTKAQTAENEIAALKQRLESLSVGVQSGRRSKPKV